MMVFDWDRAARIITERKPQSAYAGLSCDWAHTGGCIYKDGKIVTTDYTFLASTWDVPVLDIDGEAMPCYRMQQETTGWGAVTKWPKSARMILENDRKE